MLLFAVFSLACIADIFSARIHITGTLSDSHKRGIGNLPQSLLLQRTITGQVRSYNACGKEKLWNFSWISVFRCSRLCVQFDSDFQRFGGLYFLLILSEIIVIAQKFIWNRVSWLSGHWFRPQNWKCSEDKLWMWLSTYTSLVRDTFDSKSVFTAMPFGNKSYNTTTWKAWWTEDSNILRTILPSNCQACIKE